ncbi:MAG: siroheme synthase CysG [Plesiomonas sp.]|uniref:siroheme synthase CysG n=1 Tax=Plesiomonas sp. TaxID=2486279 RepID=UPI003F2FD312
MEYLPLFAQIKGRSVLVVGGGSVAERKIALLLSAHANIKIVSASLTATLQQCIEQQQLQWLSTTFNPAQLDGQFLVIAATDDNSLNAEVSAAAEARGIFVNVVDNKALCSFIVPAIIDRSPIVVAVSSGGAAPVLVRLIREKLEATLPTHLGAMATLADKWRGKVKAALPSVTARRRFWEALFGGRFSSLVQNGQQAQAEITLEQALATVINQTTAEPQIPKQSAHQQPVHQHSANDDNATVTAGEVFLVGAGPGDPGLLTLRALQVLQQADVVLYDYLVSDAILELIRRDAERLCVGKKAGFHSVPQDEINATLLALAQAGKRVVRLKGGDPFIFGRGAEELEALIPAGIPFQVVPGITAAAGATAYAGIPLTHRDYAQTAMFITGHCRPDGDQLDWSTLARGRQTLAIYMGTVKAAEIQQQLIAHGRAASTPVAIIAKGTRPDQQVLRGELQQLSTLAQHADSPALIIVGEVAALADSLHWFGERPHSPLWPSVVNLV